jgi:hypothetical protein
VLLVDSFHEAWPAKYRHPSLTAFFVLSFFSRFFSSGSKISLTSIHGKKSITNTMTNAEEERVFVALLLSLYPAFLKRLKANARDAIMVRITDQKIGYE